MRATRNEYEPPGTDAVLDLGLWRFVHEVKAGTQIILRAFILNLQPLAQRLF